MRLQVLQRFLLGFLFVAFTIASVGGAVLVPCSASADMGTMQGDRGETVPCKDMGTPCAISISSVSMTATPSYNVDLIGKLSMVLTRRLLVVTLPNGLVIAPRLTPPIHLA